MEENIDDVSSDQKESMAVPHAGPGIMLLTASMRLLYKDRRAGELCQQIIRCQDGITANGVLPPAVASLVDQIQKTLKVRTDPKDWEQIQLRRVVNTLHTAMPPAIRFLRFARSARRAIGSPSSVKKIANARPPT